MQIDGKANKRTIPEPEDLTVVSLSLIVLAQRTTWTKLRIDVAMICAENPDA